MLNLPKTTGFGKRIPKQKFYENLTITPSIKQEFIEKIKIIYWRNKIAPTTINLAEGKNFVEIEVFEIRLNTPSLDESVLKLIDKEIPYHILFILSYNEKYQLWIGYKESINGKTSFKVDGYYHTDWLSKDEICLDINGLDMDTVYENFVRQVAGDSLKVENGENLKKSIEREHKKQELQKQIEKLTKSVRKEKQFNKQMELNKQLKNLKNELISISKS